VGCRRQELSRFANGDVPEVELRPRCGWVSCGEDLISLSFSVSLVHSLSLLSRFLRPREPNRFLPEWGFSCCSNKSRQNRLSCGQMGSRSSFCFNESVCFQRKSNRKQKKKQLFVIFYGFGEGVNNVLVAFFKVFFCYWVLAFAGFLTQ
jgi:hypothetical protein